MLDGSKVCNRTNQRLSTPSRKSIGRHSDSGAVRAPPPGIGAARAAGDGAEKSFRSLHFEPLVDEGRSKMHTIVAGVFMTLDGVVQDPGGFGESDHGGWALP